MTSLTLETGAGVIGRVHTVHPAPDSRVNIFGRLRAANVRETTGIPDALTSQVIRKIRAHASKCTFLWVTCSMLLPMAACVTTTSPRCNLYRVVVFPALSRPAVREEKSRLPLQTGASNCPRSQAHGAGVPLASRIIASISLGFWALQMGMEEEVVERDLINDLKRYGRLAVAWNRQAPSALIKRGDSCPPFPVSN